MKFSDNEVYLRPYTLDDIEEHLAGEDVEQIKWLSGQQGSTESVKNWILKNQKSWEDDGPIYNLAVIEKSTNKLVGMVEANSDYEHIEALKLGDANISYVIFPKFRGKGYAIRAVNLLTKFLKDKGFIREVIRVDPKNEKSLRVPERCGFKKSFVFTAENGDKLVIYVKNLNTTLI